jgi:23S rRNA (cytidine1920-2'-O)/16S rRNA (cytidine1409-2'-O)-methyltransferase
LQALKGPKKTKLEDLLINLGLVSERVKARAMIMAGEVIVDDQRVDKPGQLIPAGAQVRLKGSQSPYVGRGGDKLEGALLDFDLRRQLNDVVVLDVGASTGGFTDACLQAGARQVIAVDVGTNQLAWSLRQDPRVTVIEKTDIRQLEWERVSLVSFIVVDVSFISLTTIVPALLALGRGRQVHYLLLVKPQFELPRALIPEGGVVESEELRQQAVESVCLCLHEHGVDSVQKKDSRLPGKEGNREVFLYFRGLP